MMKYFYTLIVFAFACVASIKAQIEVTCGGKYVNNGDVLNFYAIEYEDYAQAGAQDPTFTNTSNESINLLVETRTPYTYDNGSEFVWYGINDIATTLERYEKREITLAPGAQAKMGLYASFEMGNYGTALASVCVYADNEEIMSFVERMVYCTPKLLKSEYIYTGRIPNFEFYNISQKDVVKIIEAESNVGDHVLRAYIHIDGDTTLLEFPYHIKPAPLTIIPQDTTICYGETVHDFLFNVSGLVNGELADSVILIAPQFQTTANRNSGVGEYTITCSGAVQNGNNYDISYGSGSLHVTKAPLNIKVDNLTRTYGDDEPNYKISYEGFKNGEDEQVLKHLPVAYSANKKYNVGRYPIVLKDAEADNYKITYTNATLDIVKAPLIAKVKDILREYGEDNPNISVQYVGFKNDDDESVLIQEPVVETSAVKTSPIGTYSISLQGGEAKNYYFVGYENASLTILPAQLHLAVKDVYRKYGQDNPTLEYVLTGFKNNEDERILSSPIALATEAGKSSPVGTYPIISNDVIAPNYTINCNNANVYVGKAMLHVRADDQSRFYGMQNQKLTYSIYGFVNDEDESVLLQTPTAITSADEMSNVGTYIISVDGADAQNYDFEYSDGKLTILKAKQQISWEQMIDNACVGDQVELKAYSNSGLPVKYVPSQEGLVDIYEADGKIYMDCKKAGTFELRATQEGNINYEPALRVAKKIRIVDVPVSSASAIVSNAVSVMGSKQLIRILGVSGNSVVTVFDAKGQLLYKGTERSIHIPLTNSLVIVHVADRVYKLMLRQ